MSDAVDFVKTEIHRRPGRVTIMKSAANPVPMVRKTMGWHRDHAEPGA